LRDTVSSMINDRDHKAVMDSMGLCVFNPYKWEDLVNFYEAAKPKTWNTEQRHNKSIN
jgi:aldehyde:ferredoxin oxidoreductase